MQILRNKVRIGIVGLGDHCSKSHINYLLDMPGLCQIVAICDLEYSKAEDIIKELDTETANEVYYHKQYDDMLQNSKVDAVFIMTPDRLHTEQLVAAVEAGKHVFCEKPLASTQDEYQKLVIALSRAEIKNLIVTTCHPRRFDPPFEGLKRILVDGNVDCKESIKLGNVLHFDFNFQYHKPSKIGLHTSLMFDHLNHEVDAMNYLFGKSGIKHATKNFDSETQFHVSGARNDGITFSFFGQRKLDASIYPEYLRILCDKGSIYVDLYAGTMTVISENGSNKFWINPNLFKTNYTKRFEAINRNFLGSILGFSENYLTTEEMLMNTKLAIDLHENTFVQY